MKTTANTTILSILLTLVMMVSCSTEGDILDDMSKVETPATSGVAAAISCSINNVMTKSGATTLPAENDAEKDVENAIFFLVKGNDVLGCTNVEGGKLYTKLQSGLDVIAVAGITKEMQNALSVMTSVTAIDDYTLTNLDKLVKIGRKSNIFENSTDTEVNVAVEVAQVAARIDLVGVNYTSIVAADKVELKSVELVHQNLGGKLKGYAAKYNENTVTNKANSFYTFANKPDASAKVSLRLTFDVDGELTVREFTVKHDKIAEVKAGYVYRVTFNAKIVGSNVEPEVTFEVADWKTASVSGSLEEVK